MLMVVVAVLVIPTIAMVDLVVDIVAYFQAQQ
jgi:hypothetical protein